MRKDSKALVLYKDTNSINTNNNNNNNDNSSNNITNNNVSNYEKDFLALRDKALLIRKAEKELQKLRESSVSESQNFVEKYSKNNPKLGDFASLLGNKFSANEFIKVLENSQGKTDKELKEYIAVVKNFMNGGVNANPFSNEFTSQSLGFNKDLINQYQSFIDRFDSIELNNGGNHLNSKRYLISHQLHGALLKGSIFKWQEFNIDRSLKKGSKGVYLVVFKVLNKPGSNTIIYRYINYQDLFAECLFHYIVNEQMSTLLHGVTNLGSDYLFFLDKGFNLPEEFIKYINEMSYEFAIRDSKRKSFSVNVQPRNIVDLYKGMIKGKLIIGDLDELSVIVRLALQNNYNDLGKILSYKSGLPVDDYVKSLMGTYNSSKFNLLSKCVFVVSDLENLKDKIKAQFDDVNVNEGVQKWRGFVDSLSNTISVFDQDFRSSIKRHNQYFISTGQIPESKAIGRNRFSYNNVHINLGYARWYSTKSIGKSIDMKKIVKTYKKPTIRHPSEVYEKLREILESSPINHETQQKIEALSISLAEEKLNENNSETISIVDYNLINSKLIKVLKNCEGEIVDYINKSIKDYEMVKNSPSKEGNLANTYWFGLVLSELGETYVLSVIYGRIAKVLSRHTILENSNKLTDICVDLGKDLVNQYFHKKYLEELYIRKNKLKLNNIIQVNYRMSEWKKDNKDLVTPLWNQTIFVIFGGNIIAWLKDKSINLVEDRLRRLSLTETFNILVPTNKLLSIVDNNKDYEILGLPDKLPMIVKPNPYNREIIDGKEKEVLGGYLLNDFKFTTNLMIEKWHFKEQGYILPDNIVYKLANNLMGVGFKINKDVLNFIYEYGVEYDLIINTAESHPLLKSKRKRLLQAQFNEVSSYISKLELQENILALADVYQNVPEFFYPVRMDFRGRVYVMPKYLNYQSTELAKSLLLFSKSERLDKSDVKSINYLKAYGANCFGNGIDKKSWNDRVKWVDNNHKDIINFKDGKLIKQAENKLLFIAFCFEYNRFLNCLNNDSLYFETCFPIQLDATCNGYQHLSLLSLDRNLAKELNLTKSSWDDKPGDFYTFVCAKVIGYFKDKINQEANLSKEERESIPEKDLLTKEMKESYLRLIDLNIARKIIKKSIMTVPYNITKSTMIQYIKENFVLEQHSESTGDGNDWFQFVDDKNIRLKRKDFSVLAEGMRQVLNSDTFKIKKLLNYLNGVAKFCTVLGIPITWSTPEGIVVNQSYCAIESTKLKLFSYTKKTISMNIVNKNEYAVKKQIRSFMPNLVHSLDASSLALLNDYFNDNVGRNIFAVHDCFGVTANNAESLHSTLKVVYYKIYSDGKYLKEFDESMKRNIKSYYKDFDPNVPIDIKKFILPKSSQAEILEVIEEDAEYPVESGNVSESNNKGSLIPISITRNTKKIKSKNLLYYPDVNEVLGIDTSTQNLIMDSSYIIN